VLKCRDRVYKGVPTCSLISNTADDSINRICAKSLVSRLSNKLRNNKTLYRACLDLFMDFLEIKIRR
jgi:hypothetical protein